MVIPHLNLRHPRLWLVGPTLLGLRCEVAVGPSRPTPADSRVLVVRTECDERTRHAKERNHVGDRQLAGRKVTNRLSSAARPRVTPDADAAQMS